MFKKATLGGCLGALTRWATRYRLAQGVGGYLGGGQLLAAKGGQIRQGRHAWGRRGRQTAVGGGDNIDGGGGGWWGRRQRAGEMADASRGVRVFGRERWRRGQERRG